MTRLAEGDLAAALALVQRGMQLVPSCTDGYLVSAYLMEDAGRPDDAIPFYEEAVALAPGNAHWRLADEVAARRAYTRALAAAPDHPHAEALRRAVAGE